MVCSVSVLEGMAEASLQVGLWSCSHPAVPVSSVPLQDLRVTDVLPQMVALSETYMQVYERQGP